jgi:hypothetical protein
MRVQRGDSYKVRSVATIMGSVCWLIEVGQSGPKEDYGSRVLWGVRPSLRPFPAPFPLNHRMALEVEEQAENSEYSDANFAYGSTPLSSWLAVVQHPQVAAELAACMPGRHSMVWGSSMVRLQSPLLSTLLSRTHTHTLPLHMLIHTRRAGWSSTPALHFPAGGPAWGTSSWPACTTAPQTSSANWSSRKQVLFYAC